MVFGELFDVYFDGAEVVVAAVMGVDWYGAGDS